LIVERVLCRVCETIGQRDSIRIRFPNVELVGQQRRVVIPVVGHTPRTRTHRVRGDERNAWETCEVGLVVWARLLSPKRPMESRMMPHEDLG